MYYNKCDTHTHTLFSKHAYSTVEENVREAAEKGLELIAITDHFGVMINHINDLKAFQHIYNMPIMFPKEWHGVRLICGVESDIIDLDGHLFGYNIPVTANIVDDPEPETTLEDRITRKLSYIIASIHGKSFCKDQPSNVITRMYTKVLEHPKVKILGHPGRNGLDADWDEVLKCAKAHGKYIELNEHSFHFSKPGIKERCKHIAERCADLGVGITLGTDAHIAYHIGSFDGIYKLLEEIDFPQNLIMSRDKKTFLEAIGLED